MRFPILFLKSMAMAVACSTTVCAQESDLPAALQPYVAQLTREFSQIPSARQRVLAAAADHIRAQRTTDGDVRLTFICTHNSRRSQMAQVWAQTAAAYYGLKRVQAFSGGTEATACNPRTVAALRRAGFSIPEPTPARNPVYEIAYAPLEPPLRAFSKVYDQDGNPNERFVALMCCGQADEDCPVVHGAALRLSINYEDPKSADDTGEEVARYDARCRQIAREMFFLMALAAGRNAR